jgi:hypothetical protein
MSRIALAVVLLAAVPPQDKAPLPAPDADGWITLFNGKDLTGWSGDTSIWRVKEGYIQGQIDKVGYNTFLVCDHPFSDFVLEAKFILPKGGNSGIQYRSVVSDPKKWVVGGYQADIGAGWFGALYEERGRGVLIKADPEAAKTVKADDWNQYVIEAQGSKLKQTVNGKVTGELDDTNPKARADGVLALQYHAPGGFEIRFKDIRIKPLKK